MNAAIRRQFSSGSLKYFQNLIKSSNTLSSSHPRGSIDARAVEKMPWHDRKKPKIRGPRIGVRKGEFGVIGKDSVIMSSSVKIPKPAVEYGDDRSHPSDATLSLSLEAGGERVMTNEYVDGGHMGGDVNQLEGNPGEIETNNGCLPNAIYDGRVVERPIGNLIVQDLLDEMTSFVPDLDDIVNFTATSLVPIHNNDLDQHIKQYIDHQFRPTLRPVSYSLAYYVNESPLLLYLVELGVEVYKWKRSEAELVMRLGNRNHCEHFVDHLRKRFGFDASQVAAILTVNPQFLSDDLDRRNLDARMNYLLYKRFSLNQCRSLVTKALRWLSLTVREVDFRLGKLQEAFQFNGEEVRQCCLTAPKLATVNQNLVYNNQFRLTKILGFSGNQTRKMMLKSPRILMSNSETLERNFDFLYNEIGLDHVDIMLVPELLSRSPNITWPRIEFLREHLQMDTKPEDFLCEELWSLDDSAFCDEFAHVDVSVYKKFLRSR